MNSQIKIGRIAGIEIGLHYSWFIIAFLIVFSLVSQFHAANRNWGQSVVWSAAILTTLLFFLGLIAHEVAHALVARARGLPIKGITLFLFGGVSQIGGESKRASTEFLMAFAGPLTSAVIGGALLGAAYGSGWIPWTSPTTPGLAILVWLGYINLALAAFNMIPGFPLDGGRVLRAIAWWISGSAERGTRIAARTGQVVALLFMVYGLWQFFTGFIVSGIWMGFIGWFLLQAASATVLQQRTAPLLESIRLRDVMTSDCPVIDGNVPLQDFVEGHLLRSGRRCYIVASGHHMEGIITPHDVQAVAREDWPVILVRRAMRPLDRLHALPPDATARQALDMMSEQDVNQIPIVAGGELQGIVSRGHLLQLLQSRAELLGR